MLVTSFSQHSDFSHTLLHISDTHLLGGDRALHGVIDTDQPVRSLLERAVASGLAIDALVFTGDLTERGEPDAYQRLRALVEPFAAALGAEVVWVMGNHDEREPFAHALYGQEGDSSAQDRVWSIRGLRVIALDTSVPGYHHGELAADQLAWLAEQLQTPAEHGTVVALHHPPIPTPISLMGLIELANQDELARVIRGSDVRAILGGHLHYSTHSLLEGVPVSVAAASCYNIDLLPDESLTLRGSEAGKLASLVHVYPDRVVFSAVPYEVQPALISHDASAIPTIAKMSPEQRLAEFSLKTSEFNQRVDRQQAGE